MANDERWRFWQRGIEERNAWQAMSSRPINLIPFERIQASRLPDADTGIDTAREIREYVISDFSN
jgi:hypothetical protein